MEEMEHFSQRNMYKCASLHVYHYVHICEHLSVYTYRMNPGIVFLVQMH